MTDKEVIEMLKEMQEKTAHTMGFFLGHVTQAWVIRELLGAKIAEFESRKMEVGDGERKYVIVCNEHSGMWSGTLLFWGHRTLDHESRSFGGYTSDIDGCELYSDREIKEKGYHFPRYHEGMTWEEFRGYDDMLIEPEYLEKLGYKQMRVWYKP